MQEPAAPSVSSTFRGRSRPEQADLSSWEVRESYGIRYDQWIGENFRIRRRLTGERSNRLMALAGRFCEGYRAIRAQGSKHCALTSSPAIGRRFSQRAPELF